ncbi:hypothetical protein [Streptomyces parvus]|uniref:hypothetical protein n=1 Tax=Streptomyces parvus TaxID=66428 RepID=UPI003F4D5A29
MEEGAHESPVEDGAAATAATGEEVWQYGPGRLWEEIEQVCWEYEAAGRPDAEQFGLTVTDRGQQIWLRDPSEIIRPSEVRPGGGQFLERERSR